MSDLDTPSIFIPFWRISQAAEGKLCPPVRATNLFLYQHYYWWRDDDWGEKFLLGSIAETSGPPCKILQPGQHGSANERRWKDSQQPTNPEWDQKQSLTLKPHSLSVTFMKVLGHIFVSLPIYSSGRHASKWLNKQNSEGLCKYRGKCLSHFSDAQSAFHTSFPLTLNSQ